MTYRQNHIVVIESELPSGVTVTLDASDADQDGNRITTMTISSESPDGQKEAVEALSDLVSALDDALVFERPTAK